MSITKKQGLAGITNSVEDVIIARDIILAKETGARLHLCHCSKGQRYHGKTGKGGWTSCDGRGLPTPFYIVYLDMVPVATTMIK